MNSLVATKLEHALRIRGCPNGLDCEGTLRVAASTLADAPRSDISATTVVGVLGADDVDAFEALVRDIAEECGVEPHIRLRVGGFSVRFVRHH